MYSRDPGERDPLSPRRERIVVLKSDGPSFVVRATLQGSPRKVHVKNNDKNNARDEPVDRNAARNLPVGPSNAKTLVETKPGASLAHATGY
jgi:hypothetical protein